MPAAVAEWFQWCQPIPSPRARCAFPTTLCQPRCAFLHASTRDSKPGLVRNCASTRTSGTGWGHSSLPVGELSWLTHEFGTPGALLAMAQGWSSPCRRSEQGLQGAAGRVRFWRSVTATWQGLRGSGWVPAAAIGIIKSRSCRAKQPQLPRGVPVLLSSAWHCAQCLPAGPRLASGEAAPENCQPRLHENCNRGSGSITGRTSVRAEGQHPIKDMAVCGTARAELREKAKKQTLAIKLMTRRKKTTRVKSMFMQSSSNHSERKSSCLTVQSLLAPEGGRPLLGT